MTKTVKDLRATRNHVEGGIVRSSDEDNNIECCGIRDNHRKPFRAKGATITRVIKLRDIDGKVTQICEL